MQIKGKILACALVTMLLTLTSSYSQRFRTLTITPSNVRLDVAERKQRQPKLTASQLAQYANELVKERGFDYYFDVCNAVPQRYRTKAVAWQVPNEMSLSNGRKLSTEFTVLNPGESLCSECWAAVPALQVTKDEILFVSEGKHYRVRRSADFLLGEAALLNASMKKVVRTWQLPFQSVPAGISADGTKLYLDFNTEFGLEDLVVEFSADGRLAWRARAEICLRDDGEWIKSPAGSKLSFRRYRAGNKKYIVRFVPPCT
jgi:hypothetical protein